MKIAEQYACKECGNESWYEETCHSVPMEKLCVCGSGKFPSECHGEDQQVSEQVDEEQDTLTFDESR